MRQSRLMLLQYLTGVGIVILGALHFALLSFAGGGYKNALEFTSVVSVYTTFGLVFELFLVLLTYHIFYGFKRILCELHQGKVYETAVTWLMVIAGGATFLWGTRTILIFLGVLH
jgi:succinate dehydrogenase / fumarate reductase membrane anchor subunit